jgi:hypothetical protein
LLDLRVPFQTVFAEKMRALALTATEECNYAYACLMANRDVVLAFSLDIA